MASPTEQSQGQQAAGNMVALPTTGINIDPSIASACNIPGTQTFFEFDSANISGPAKETLTSVATCLDSGPLKGQRVTAVGYADPRGTDEYNYQLGRSRAESVGDYLINHGVERANIVIISKGESMSTANDERGFAYDRRVDIRLAK